MPGAGPASAPAGQCGRSAPCLRALPSAAASVHALPRALSASWGRNETIGVRIMAS